ncbi:hypothetical protein CRG98_043548 [Punica granatum]|uniref:Uncharacterized protein n=1 Tax=Punica granatum TaxID=22663 RepID=A0A2I0HWJ3_PUNGR|nr:hypothetical protein CRG98_043548 [Punica granatum]
MYVRILNEFVGISFGAIPRIAVRFTRSEIIVLLEDFRNRHLDHFVSADGTWLGSVSTSLTIQLCYILLVFLLLVRIWVEYSVSTAYDLLTGSLHQPPDQLWKFIWNWPGPQSAETTLHVLRDCIFVQATWVRLLSYPTRQIFFLAVFAGTAISLICALDLAYVMLFPGLFQETQRNSMRRAHTLGRETNKKFCLWEPVIDQEESKERPLRVDDPSEVALQEQLKSVAACSELRNAVKNEDLQRRIRKIDSSEDAETELDKAMEGDVFRTLMDKALPPIGTKCVLRIGASCKILSAINP